MVSAERMFELNNISSEKDLRNDYDRQIGLTEEVEAAAKGESLHL